MKVYPTEAIRNLAVIGHGDAGKTQLVSSLLYVAGATPRWGKVDEGTTVTDYEEDSIARKITLNTALAHLEHRDTKLNFIDTPGYAAFVAHARPALRVADCAIVVVDGVKGVEVQTEKTWAYANEFMVPRVMVITKLDKEHADFGAALESAQKTFSRAIIPFTLPIGKEKDFRGVVDVVHMKAYELGADGQAKEIDIPSEGRDIVDKTRERLVELVAESNDQLMEKYFEQGTLDEADILPNINNAIAQSKLCPVFAVSSITQVGLRALLNGLVDYAPDPAHHEAEWGKPVDAASGRRTNRTQVQRQRTILSLLLPHRRRSVCGPHQRLQDHQRSSVRLMPTRSTPLAEFPNVSARCTRCRARQLDKVTEAHAGDIIACVKLKETQTGDTLCDKQAQIVYDPVEYPEAAIAFAIEPKSRQDEEKISVALHKILEEDPALHFSRDAQTKEFLLSGSGQLHVETVVEKLKKRYGVEVTLHPPKVPYKETITQRAEVQGRHKKQTGGRGQFGDCKCVFEPLPRGGGFVFEDKIFGGSVPQQFRPAIEKGIIEAAKSGAIAGYPLVDFKVQLVDGSYHPVDSDEHSFRAAGRKAFRAAMEKVKPSLLEPVMDVEIAAPQEYSGDIMGDLELAPRSRAGNGDERQAAGDQSAGADGRNAQLPIDTELDHRRARFVPHAVFALRSGSGPVGPKDRGAVAR